MEEAYLTIIKSALHSNTMHIRIQHGGHLCLLYRAHFALRIHNKHTDILLASQPVNRSASSVSASRTNDSQSFSVLPLFALIPSHKEVLEQVSNKL